MRRWLATILFAAFAAPAPAAAADEAQAMADATWEMLEKLPPSHSWDLGLRVGYGPVSYLREETPAWFGFGIRGVWGAHLGELRQHRVGVQAEVVLEGPAPSYFIGGLEPQAAWDMVVGRLTTGASLGGSVLVHSMLTKTGSETGLGVAPIAAVRVGYSQPWSRVTRRLFIVAEPRVRWVQGAPDPGVSLVLGSGRGR